MRFCWFDIPYNCAVRSYESYKINAIWPTCLSVRLTFMYQGDTYRTEFVNFHTWDSYKNLLGNLVKI